MTKTEQGTGCSDRHIARGDTRQEQAYDTIFLNESSIFYNLDVREETLAAYEEAIQLAPSEAILHLHKGHALEQLGRQTEAQRSYEEARRLGYNA